MIAGRIFVYNFMNVFQWQVGQNISVYNLSRITVT